MAGTSVVGSIMRKPVILGLGVLLIVCIVAVGGNFFLAQQKAGAQQTSAASLSLLRGFSESIAKNALAAADGHLEYFPALADQKQHIDKLLSIAQLAGGNAALQSAVGRIGSQWSTASLKLMSC